MEPTNAQPDKAVFISYRRADTADLAGRIYDRLVERFGEERVFKDVDSIQPGVAFADYIVESIARSAVELVIIGPRWLTISAGWNRRRLDDPRDFVRIEIETALREGAPVIPLLVMGAIMPPVQRLPDSLKRLVERNGMQVRPDPDFRRDMERVIAAIEYWMERPRSAPATISAPPTTVPPATQATAPVASSPPAVADERSTPAPVQTPAPPSAPAATGASISAAPNVSHSGQPVRQPAARSVAQPTAPPKAEPDIAPRKSRRPAQPVFAIAAAAVVVALLGVTLNSLGVFAGKGAASLPAAARTQTAIAHAELTQFPFGSSTSSYGPTAPGACDTGALKAEWTNVLGNDSTNVHCAGSAASITGPVILEFLGNGGFQMGAQFAVTISNFTASSNSDCLNFIVGFPHTGGTRSEVDANLCPNGALTGGYVAGFAKQPISPATVSLAGGSVVLRIVVSDSEWKLMSNSQTLASMAYINPDSGPTQLNVVDIKVATGAQVTLSAFTISPPAA